MASLPPCDGHPIFVNFAMLNRLIFPVGKTVTSLNVALFSSTPNFLHSSILMPAIFVTCSVSRLSIVIASSLLASVALVKPMGHAALYRVTALLSATHITSAFLLSFLLHQQLSCQESYLCRFFMKWKLNCYRLKASAHRKLYRYFISLGQTPLLMQCWLNDCQCQFISFDSLLKSELPDSLLGCS